MKFKYYQKVKVIDGFYKGLEGVITDHRLCFKVDRYWVKMEGTVNNTHVNPENWILEANLEVVE